ncbi:MAG: hypothetical protein F4Z40_03690 [Chloroflexi bacterium]|nr:hypothetical protein [Chloroflexota bacterium]
MTRDFSTRIQESLASRTPDQVERDRKRAEDRKRRDKERAAEQKAMHDAMRSEPERRRRRGSKVPDHDKPFVIIPERVLEMGLSARAIHVYLAIRKWFNYEQGHAWASQELLLESLGRDPEGDRSYLKRGIRELREAGVLATDQREDPGRYKSNSYRFPDPSDRGANMPHGSTHDRGAYLPHGLPIKNQKKFDPDSAHARGEFDPDPLQGELL